MQEQLQHNMYHFTADHPPEPVRLSFRALIPGHIRQYLKDFQLDAIRFMHTFLAKGEFCAYNDESGLGKQAAVVVLLDAACSNRKCLIVVQNDDRYLNGWEFHFNVLTKTNIAVIKNDKDTADSLHSIYIAKWSTLRTIDDLSKFKFDFIILDNRGQMLNNSFCTAMLLKHYERKINLLISSVDITSDLKLLHNVLRLGGRLDPQYSSFKVFEEKFKLPDAKELAYKRVDLEEYFCKRERLADYCRPFRLRRYCHQFETHVPLVKEDRYTINLDLWREKQNATNSESSSIEYVNHSNHENEHIKDTQELFEEYCRQRRKQHLQFQQEEEQRLQQREREMLKSLEGEKDIIYNVDDEVALINDTPPMITEKVSVSRDNSDEQILMSPLLVESDSDRDDTPELSNVITDIEIVDLSSEEKEYNFYKQNEDTDAGNSNCKTVEYSSNSSKSDTFSKRKVYKKRSEVDKLREDIVDSLKIKVECTRLSRHTKAKDNSKVLIKKLKGNLKEKTTHIANSNNARSNEKTPKSLKNCSNVSLSLRRGYKSSEKRIQSKKEKKSKENSKDSINVPESVVQKNGSTPKNTQTFNEKGSSKLSSINSTSNLNSGEKGKTTLKINVKTNESSNPTTPLTSKKPKAVHKVENTFNDTPTNSNDSQLIKQEISEVTPQAKIAISKDSHAETKSEKIRIKRELEIAPRGIHHKQTRSMQRLTRSSGCSKYLTKHLSLHIDKIKKTKKKPALKEAPKSIETNKNKELDDDNSKHRNKNKKSVEDKTKNGLKNTQSSIILHSSSQDYESLQCAQRLSDVVVFDSGMEGTHAFLIPPTPNAIGRNSLIPHSLTSSPGFFTQSEVIFIPPSNPNNATANRKRDQVMSISSSDNENSTSQSSSTNASMTSRRTRALKPKRNQQQTIGEANKMSSFTDLLSQQNTRSSAKSPDLFSNCSDLIQIPCTQPNLDTQEPNTPFEGFKIFGSEVKQLQQHYAFNKNNHIHKHHPNPKKSYQEQRSCLDILEKMFEPSNKKPKQVTNEKSCTSAKKSNRVATNKQKAHTHILPSHPIEVITEARQQQELQKKKHVTAGSSAGLLDDDLFEITNNGTFGSVMRLHSNGDISPVQHTQKANAKQHNKITNYLIGNTTQNGSQEEPTPNSGGYINTEAGTPSKRHQLLTAVQIVNVKKSPKGKCNTTQTTKLTKWFTKPAELSSQETSVKAKSNSKKSLTKQVRVDLTVKKSLLPVPSGKRILKRRRLDVSFNK